MDSSQSSATNAALSYLKGKGMDVSGVKVSMHVDDIGGPSAGMMYALGVIDKLTEADETGGKTIAGTGTIDAKGKVGAIGAFGSRCWALRDGATWFLAPESNCNEVVGTCRRACVSSRCQRSMRRIRLWWRSGRGTPTDWPAAPHRESPIPARRNASGRGVEPACPRGSGTAGNRP